MSDALWEESHDISVIGAGLSGLTGGAYLAKQGYRVAFTDRNDRVGGCAVNFQEGESPQ